MTHFREQQLTLFSVPPTSKKVDGVSMRVYEWVNIQITWMLFGQKRQKMLSMFAPVTFPFFFTVKIKMTKS